MSEMNSFRTATKTVLRDIAKHASGLAAGLQNAAPPQEGGSRKVSPIFNGGFSLASRAAKFVRSCRRIAKNLRYFTYMPNKAEQDKQHLLALVQETLQRDKALREKYGIGEKFRFIKDRLEALGEQIEKFIAISNVASEERKKDLAEDEMLVYVYLYNTQGLILQTWANMLTPKLFYEYSINRPIYSQKKFVEDLIKNKANRVQHAYLTVCIKKNLIISEAATFDAFQNPVLKVKEGALTFDRLIAFTHNEQDYQFGDEGFIKKV